MPAGEAELGALESELAVDPAGEAVADEWGVDGAEEELMGVVVGATALLLPVVWRIGDWVIGKVEARFPNAD